MESNTGPVLGVALTVRFVLELCLLAAVSWWGFTTPDSVALQILLGIGAPVVVATVWGVFISPKATVKLPLGARLVIELALFGLAALGLWAVGRESLAVALIAAEILTVVLLTALGRPPGTT